ncbi:hypothetical protein [Halobacterium yunchengense]|uniref:hypothetical protein n=1 Tax=Halobacterium yunchengense TaxID=3108497 RepID=UPI003008734A
MNGTESGVESGERAASGADGATESGERAASGTDGATESGERAAPGTESGVESPEGDAAAPRTICFVCQRPIGDAVHQLPCGEPAHPDCAAERRIALTQRDSGDGTALSQRTPGVE